MEGLFNYLLGLYEQANVPPALMLVDQFVTLIKADQDEEKSDKLVREVERCKLEPGLKAPGFKF